VCPSLCALAAGLLVGQTQDITIYNAEPVQPSCKHCAASANAGWTQVQTSTQTRTWSQTGVWTPAGGWTWHASSDNVGEERPFLARVSDRLNGLFGSRPESAGHAISRPSTGWQSTSWHDEDASVVSSEPADHFQRLPVGHVTTNEPPLLEVASQPVTADIKAASFEPAPIAGTAFNKAGTIQPALLSKIGHAEDYSWLIGQVEIANGAHVVHYAAPASHDHFGGRMVLNGEVDLSRFKNGDLVAVHGGVIPGHAVSLYRVQSVELIKPFSISP
jgi:hypothetical protein